MACDNMSQVFTVYALTTGSKASGDSSGCTVHIVCVHTDTLINCDVLTGTPSLELQAFPMASYKTWQPITKCGFISLLDPE